MSACALISPPAATDVADAAYAPADAESWPTRRMLAARRVSGSLSANQGADQGAIHDVLSLENLIEEVPVALVYNGVSHAVMLASPGDLHDFALGFSLAEGILQHRRELYDCEAFATAEGIELRLDIASERRAALQARRRSLAGRTGCGLCGVESLQAASRPVTALAPRTPVAASVIQRALAELPARQPLHRATGAAHAAGWASNDGALQLVREDVGRHNALDKLIGALARRDRDGFDPASGFVVVTSRASYEMVQKTAAVGIGLLAAVSAPTAYAARLAEASNLTLIGLARPGRLTAYSHPQQLSAC